MAFFRIWDVAFFELVVRKVSNITGSRIPKTIAHIRIPLVCREAVIGLSYLDALRVFLFVEG